MQIRQKLEAAIVRALDEGAIVRDDVTQIAVAIARDYHSLQLFCAEEWDSFASHEPGDAISEVPLDDWLAAIDAAGIEGHGAVQPAEEPMIPAKARMRFADERMQAVYDAHKTALRREVFDAVLAIAAGDALGEFPKPVGLMVQGIANTPNADVVAFVHPSGNQGVWPIRERHLPNTSSSYGWALLASTGVVLAYPEDGDREDDVDEAMRTLRFDDVDVFFVDDDDLSLRLEGATQNIELSPGHCHEEHGGPDSEQVRAALIAHFRRHIGDREHDPGVMPEPEAPEFELWCERQLRLGFANRRAFRSALERFGPERARIFLDRMGPEAEGRAACFASLAETQLAAHRYDDALATLRTETERGKHWAVELRALLQLGRYDEALSRSTAVETKATAGLRVMKALALVGLGRLEEAQAAIDPFQPENLKADAGWREVKDAAVASYVAARIAYPTAPDRAQQALAHALRSSNTFPWIESDYANCPELLEQFAEHRGWVERCDRGLGEFDQAYRQVETPEVELQQERALLLAIAEGRGNDATGALAGSEHSTVRWVTRASGKAPTKIVQLLVPKRGQVWLRDKDNVLHVLDDATSDLPVLTSLGKLPVSVSDVALVNETTLALAADDDGLVIARREGDAWRVAGKSVAPFHESASCVAVQGDLAAVGESKGVQLFTLSGDGSLRLHVWVGVPKGGRSVALAGNLLAVGTFEHGVCLFDVTDRDAPVLLSVTGQAERHEISGLRFFGDLLLASASRKAWLLEVRDPKAPRALARITNDSHENLPAAWHELEPSADGTRNFIAFYEHHTAYHVTVAPDGGVAVHSSASLCEADGDSQTLYYSAGATVLSSTTVVATSRDDWLVMRAEPCDFGERPGDPEASISERTVADALLTWADGELATVHGPVGMVTLEYTGSFELHACPPVSAPLLEGLGIYQPRGLSEEHPTFEVRLDELPGLGGVTVPEGELARERMVARLVAGTRLAAMELPDVESLRNNAAGRLYGVYVDGKQAWVLTTRVREDRAWAPWRPEYRTGLTDDLATLLDRDDGVARVLRQVLDGNTDVAEVLTLALEGQREAVAVLRKLAERRPRAGVPALLRVAQASEPRARLAKALGGHVAEPGVKDLLAAWREAPGDRQPEAVWWATTVALGQTGDPTLANRVRAWLGEEDVETTRVKEAWEHLDVNQRAGLLDAVQAASDRLTSQHYAYPLFGRMLFEAGLRELPSALAKLALEEKKYEGYGGFLDDDDDPRETALGSERLFATQILADRAKLLVSGDLAEDLYPTTLAPEPADRNWRGLAQALVAVLDRDGVLAEFVQAFGRRAWTNRGECDRHLVGALMTELFAKERIFDAEPLARALADAPAGMFPEKQVEAAKTRVEYAELQRGWELLKERKLGEARQVADSLLRRRPSDGQVMFFDARLDWLETGDIDRCVGRSEEYLRRLERDPQGRARLLNLIGCCLDEKKRAGEALSYFEEASRTVPEEPMYIANIAEVHHKCGDPVRAREAALRARAKGHDSPILREILGDG